MGTKTAWSLRRAGWRTVSHTEKFTRQSCLGPLPPGPRISLYTSSTPKGAESCPLSVPRAPSTLTLKDYQKQPFPPPHTPNLFLGGKVINTAGFPPHPPTWPGAGMGKALPLAGRNNHMADTGLPGWGRSLVRSSPQSPTSLRLPELDFPSTRGPAAYSSMLAAYGGMFL